ncbi:MAG: response regulator [Pikeienuella sp.]
MLGISAAPSLIWVVIPIGLMAAVAVTVGLLRMKRRNDVIAAFHQIYGSASDAALLSNDGGWVIAANAAARDGLSVEGLITVSDLILDKAGDPEGVAYRLMRKVSVGAEVAENLSLDNGVRLTARKLGDTVVLWRLSLASPPKSISGDGAPFAFARFDPSGAENARNEGFAELSFDQRRRVREAVFGLSEQGLCFGEIEIAPDDQRQLAIAPHAYGGVSAFLIEPGDPVGAANTTLLDAFPAAMVTLSADGTIASANHAAKAMLGRAAEAGMDFRKVFQSHGRPLSVRLADAAVCAGVDGPEQVRGLIDGKEMFLHLSLTQSPYVADDHVIAMLTDATQLHTLEQQFVQSQKMQAVGQLAGGVAHDFNNLLTAILGHCDLLMFRADASGSDFADLTQIKQNANRAAALVRQLLAFSRKQTLTPKHANVLDTMNELAHLLGRLLGEKIRIEQDSEDMLWPVWIDERQFEQVIINLAVNARDAMPDGGVLALTYRNLVLTEALRRDRAVVPAGDYVRIEVADSGTGIPHDKILNVFEPFYTTKKQGEGTGLGLSTAYGIIKQMGGFIFVDNGLVCGAIFTIFLPRHTKAIEPEPIVVGTVEHTRDVTGSSSVLLVEDEAAVRAFARRALTMRGYDVTDADCAEAALDILSDEAFKFDLVISDVVMPGMDGPSWVMEARKARPDLKVIFISGYADDVFGAGICDLGEFTFLPKPFSLDDLTMTVKSVLSGEAAPTELTVD